MTHLRDIEDVSEFDRLEIHHFFEVYKALEPGKEVETATWVNQAAAWRDRGMQGARSQHWRSGRLAGNGDATQKYRPDSKGLASGQRQSRCAENPR
jgi:hypothetical protein